MGEVTTSEARALFSELINRAIYKKERVVLTRRGKAVVAIVPIEDYEELEEMDRLEDEIDAKEIPKVWAEQGDEPMKSLKEVAEELGLGRTKRTASAPSKGKTGSRTARPAEAARRVKAKK